MIRDLLETLAHARKGKVNDDVLDDLHSMLHQQERYDVSEVQDIVMVLLGKLEPQAAQHKNGELDFKPPPAPPAPPKAEQRAKHA